MAEEGDTEKRERGGGGLGQGGVVLSGATRTRRALSVFRFLSCIHALCCVCSCSLTFKNVPYKFLFNNPPYRGSGLAK